MPQSNQIQTSIFRIEDLIIPSSNSRSNNDYNYLSANNGSYLSEINYSLSNPIRSNSRRLDENLNYSSNSYESELERRILSSSNPIDIRENEEIEVNGIRGIYANKSEVDSWRGSVPLSNYIFNYDPNPDVVYKKPVETVKYKQEILTRFLRPPTPERPGDIIIRKEPDIQSPPAPPLVIRQLPTKKPRTPEPLIIREAPPEPPKPVPPKIIVVPGKRLPPPPRRVIIEKLPDLPPKPPTIIVERWLAPEEPKRRIVYEKPVQPKPLEPPKNVIIEWEKPCVEIEKKHVCLGVHLVNPNEYKENYEHEIKPDEEFTDIMKSLNIDLDECENCSIERFIPTPAPELEGDIEALKYIDLDREGLGQYKKFLDEYLDKKKDSN